MFNPFEGFPDPSLAEPPIDEDEDFDDEDDEYEDDDEDFDDEDGDFLDDEEE